MKYIDFIKSIRAILSEGGFAAMARAGEKE